MNFLFIWNTAEPYHNLCIVLEPAKFMQALKREDALEMSATTKNSQMNVPIGCRRM